jgi:hypothetical protein
MKKTQMKIVLFLICTAFITASCSTQSIEDTQSAKEEPSPNQTTKPLIETSDLPHQLKRLSADWKTNWNKHNVPFEEFLSGGPPRDGIPSIDEPEFISIQKAQSWLKESEPVIILELNRTARAYPLQILMWHEIVNDSIDGEPVMITFCPLCNAAIAFDRRINGQVYEFGTSGLLRNSDLVMYDRTTESLWQQFTGEAIVGDMTGNLLMQLPSSIVSFGEFQKAFPKGEILSRDTGFSRNYGQNPYVGYDRIDSSPFLYDKETDGRLLPMERVITVSLPTVDAAYPLKLISEHSVIQDVLGNQHLVVFHQSGTNSALDSSDIAEGRDIGSTGVFDPVLDGEQLTFYLDGTKIKDHQTESTWNVLGQAISGSLTGKRLSPIVHGDHFWFAWAAFKPSTIVYQKE